MAAEVVERRRVRVRPRVGRAGVARGWETDFLPPRENFQIQSEKCDALDRFGAA